MSGVVIAVKADALATKLVAVATGIHPRAWRDRMPRRLSSPAALLWELMGVWRALWWRL